MNKNIFIFSDDKISFGEMKSASLIVQNDVIIKNRFGTNGINVSDFVYSEDDEKISITLMKKNNESK